MKLSDEHFEQLTAYIDGELNEHERREVEALVARDPQAAALLESLRQVSNSVAALPREAAPMNLSAAVQERLARRTLLNDEANKTQDLPRLVLWTNRLAVAACLALVCTAGWLGIQSSGVRTPALKENGPVPIKKDGFVKESNNNELVLKNPPTSLKPLGPAGPIDPLPHVPLANPDMRTMVAYRDAGELEKRLNKSGVSNFELQQADLSSISNQLVIETDDPEIHDSIVRVVEDNLNKNRIPDLNTRRLPEPVQATQSFFVSQARKKQSMTGEDETWIAVNAPMKVAQELMACVNTVRAQKKGPMQVEVNGCMMETASQATQILEMNSAYNQKQLEMKKQESEPEWVAPPPPPAAADSAEPATGHSLNDGESDLEAGDRAKREASDPPGMAKKQGPKSPSKSPSAEAKKVESKTTDRPSEAGTRTDNDDDSMRQKGHGGRVGAAPSLRGGTSKDEHAADDRKRDTPPASVAALAPPLAKADGCVTLSICVRNPDPQRGRVSEPSTTTQASDTIRSSGATSKPQTSMPAAGVQP